MKRRTWLLVGLLIFVAAACGGSDQGESAAGDKVAPSADATAEAAESTPAPEPTAAPVSTAEATAAPDPAEVDAEPADGEPREAEPVAAAAEPVDPVAFDDDFGTSVAPIFAEKCASCHNAGGPGAVHWQLETAADLVATHEWINGVVSTGYMPPWPASELSLVFHDNRSLRTDEIEAIAAWSSAGAPLDVDPTEPILATGGIEMLDADVELLPHESYQGSTAVADDYRCFIYELPNDTREWVQSFEFRPDQTQVVHHAIGYLLPGSELERARELSAEDEAGGWQCYGGSRLNRDKLFLGWAPGQLATEFPEGSGIVTDPGDFIVLQIHYHYDTEAPADESTLLLDWAEGSDLDRIEFDEYIGPAEIPCASTETGPFCDRETALRRAYADYGIEGVLADGINQICGVHPSDFADMTDGIASSSCSIPVRDFGEIVSVFGHEHEIGKSIRMTLNAGTSDERILLDIPDWDFDWQYNYYPVETIELVPGDELLLECTWDRSRRDPELEPAYVLWADGTNDEMCFATIATRTDGSGPGADEAIDGLDEPQSVLDVLNIPDEVRTCLADAGFALDEMPSREQIDPLVEQLFVCAPADEIGAEFARVIAENFDGLVGDDGVQCLADRLATTDGASALLYFALPDSTDAERQPVGEFVGDCVRLSQAVINFGFPIAEEAHACVDEAGRDLLVQATIDGALPEPQTIFGILNPCLSGE